MYAGPVSWVSNYNPWLCTPMCIVLAIKGDLLPPTHRWSGARCNRCCGARALLTSLVNERRLLLDSQFDASVIPLFLIRMWAVVKRIHGSDTTYMFRRGRTLSSVNRCLSSKLNVNRQSHNSSIGYGLCSMRFAFADVISSHTLICLHTRRGMIDWVKLGGTLESYGRALSQRIHAASPSQAPRKPRGQAGHPQGRPSPFFRRVGVARTTWQDRLERPSKHAPTLQRLTLTHRSEGGLPTPHSYRHDHDCPACPGKCELYQSQGIYRPGQRLCSWNQAL